MALVSQGVDPLMHVQHEAVKVSAPYFGAVRRRVG
eukprot:CAMPEP_0205939540 /NCGR_PEP_ID=MMETSP1325-20131115/49893_1 /ASSEMBLY_ACC=CAM_ASM_000708 /TAXON_ID=236786 /ORGANISM="Florenciella sp., Strain RCC1007" /LENGTH=34 /DNA_ID= /DNA_START= /DNA_END= /DNA_ORIENTATION=